MAMCKVRPLRRKASPLRRVRFLAYPVTSSADSDVWDVGAAPGKKGLRLRARAYTSPSPLGCICAPPKGLEFTVHGDLGAEATVAQVRPVADLAVTEAHPNR